MSRPILIVAGEASGDNVGGLLASEIKSLRPELELFGIGGDRMDMAQVNLRYHASQLAFLGFWEVLKHLPFIKKVETDLLREIDKRNPSLAILIDYPGFNLRLAEKLKARNIAVMYYVSPQVWAWGRKRIAKIKRLVDKMVVVFQFEQELYRSEGMEVEWFGHPLLEIVHPRRLRGDFLNKIGMSDTDKFIGLFPGSRKQEIERILPVMRDSVRLTGMPGIVGGAPGIDDALYRDIIGTDCLIVRGQTYDLMCHAELNLVASGTATLECAILGRPLFILYKTSPVTYLIARNLVKIPYIGLVNVVAGKKIVPEFIQGDCQPGKIGPGINRFLSDELFRTEMLSHLAYVKTSLGDSGASRKTAEIAIALAERNPDI